MMREKIERVLPELCKIVSEIKDARPYLSDPPSGNVDGIPFFDFTEEEYQDDQDLFEEIGVSICLDKDGSYSVGKVKNHYNGGNTIIDISKKSCDHLVTGMFHTHPIWGNYPSTLDLKSTPDGIDFICIGGIVGSKKNIKCYEPRTSFSNISKSILKDEENFSPKVKEKTEAVFVHWNRDPSDPNDVFVADIKIYNNKDQLKIDGEKKRFLNQFFTVQSFDCDQKKEKVISK